MTFCFQQLSSPPPFPARQKTQCVSFTALPPRRLMQTITEESCVTFPRFHYETCLQEISTLDMSSHFRLGLSIWSRGAWWSWQQMGFVLFIIGMWKLWGGGGHSLADFAGRALLK